MFITDTILAVDGKIFLMKKWEYKIIRLEELSNSFDRVDLMPEKYENNKDEFSLIKSGYNNLGHLGWELVQIKEDKYGEIYYFKREKK
jgi:hypothetical protein